MNKFERLFRLSAVLILFLTSVAKLASSTGQAPILELPDPLLGIARRQMLVAVGVLELIIAVALLSPLESRRKHLLLLWLGTSFLVYRLSFHWINPGKPCPCLGSLSDKLPISEATLDAFLWAVIVYFLIGSISLLLWLRRLARGNWTPESQELEEGP